MAIEFFYFSLMVLPVFVSFAFTIAGAGHRTGSRGARSTAFTIWVVLAFVQPVLWPLGLQFPSLYWLLSPVVAAITLAMILIPIETPDRWSWTRGRLAAGLVGAAVTALVYPSLVLFAMGITF